MRAKRKLQSGRRSRFREKLRNTYKSARNIWSLYKTSREGLVGLGILLVFVVMAIFAPWIAPFTPDHVAPSCDVFKTDRKNIDLKAYNFSTTFPPIGVIESEFVGGTTKLARILVYSSNGTALVFPVSIRPGPTIRIDKPVHHKIPPNMRYMRVVFCSNQFSKNIETISIFFGVNDTALFVFDRNLNLLSQFNLSFKPIYYSEIWNFNGENSNLLFAVADTHNIFLYSRSYYVDITTGGKHWATTVSNITDNTMKIISAPLILNQRSLPPDFPFPNGTVMIVPTETSLRGYNLTGEERKLPGAESTYVIKLKIGSLLWNTSFTIDGITYHPVEKHAIILPYPGSDQRYGKDNIIVATKENVLLSFYRNGKLLGIQKFFVLSTTIRAPALDGIFSTERAGADETGGILATASAGRKNIIGLLDPKTALVRWNGTAFNTTEGRIIGEPHFISSMKIYLLSTSDKIYLLEQNMRLSAAFTVRGGLATPAVFLGNIIERTSETGNYFAVITRENKFYVSAVKGCRVTPLPPGFYKAEPADDPLDTGRWYLLGTDDIGHDLFSWMVYGTRTELVVGIFAALLSVGLGTFIGVVAGYFGGWIDSLISRTIEVMLSLPGLVIMLLLASVLGPSIWNIILIIGILGWAGIAWVIRSVALSLKARPFIDSARVSGASPARIIFIHIYPNVLPYTFFYMTITVSGAIITEAALAFLGFGDPNAVTWGMMLQYLRLSGYTLQAWWWLLSPGIAITLLSLSFYLIGRAFDEVVNPRLRKRQ